jgi:hypothetical protein
MEDRDQRIWQYRVHCGALVEKWHCLLDYQDLDAWFDSNRCCLPINLAGLLDKEIIKKETTI